MASRRNPKSLLNTQFAAVARALGHAHRLELLEYLGQGEWPVDTLAEKTGLGFANVSQHLQQLRRCGLVVNRRSGKNILYRMADGPAIEAIAAIMRFAESNIAEVREVIGTYLTSLDAMEAISQEELVARMQDGTVTLLDVRPEDEFLRGHLPGARNVTLRKLEAKLSELPRNREIIAYCRGPYCILSYRAVHLLRARGYKVRRLQDGFPQWRAAGRPVEIDRSQP